MNTQSSLGFVETAGLVIAIQVADTMAKAAEVQIIAAHKVDGLRVCVICKGDVAACQAAVAAGAEQAHTQNGLLAYNVIPSPEPDSDELEAMLQQIVDNKAARKIAKAALRATAAKADSASEEASKPRSKK